MLDLNQAELCNNALGAVFAALTSVNLETATAIASKYGYHQLSAMIAMGPTCAEYLQDQVRQWQVAGNVKFMSGDILRVYSLLGGDLKQEEQRYKCGNKSIDWKRRLGMLFFYSCDSYGGDFDVESLVNAYQSSVDHGVAQSLDLMLVPTMNHVYSTDFFALDMQSSQENNLLIF